MKKNPFAAGDSAVAMWAALASIAMVAAAAPLPPAADLVGYTYSVNRAGAEKTPGSLCDGDSSSGLYWHTKTVARTEIVCELSETSDIDRIEIFAPKWTRWYIVKELQVAVDDGFGGFGDPVVLPGLAPSPKGSQDLHDASCTNHVFSAGPLGKAARIKVSIVSDAAAAIGEIRLHGKSGTVAAATPAPTPAPAPATPYHTIENSQWRLAFNPLGGRAMSVYSKAIGTELTSPTTYGSFVEEDWNRRKSHDFLITKPYAMTYESGPGGTLLATATGNAQGGGIDFLRITKHYSATDDSTALKVDYTFENIPEAMALQNYAPLVHTTLGVFGRDVTCYFPTTEGIVAFAPGKRGNDTWQHHPARGWLAAATDDGTGVAVTMPFAEVKTFYSWFSQVPTLEWRMIPIGLDAGESRKISTEVIPFKGLSPVSGAGGGLVGSLADGRCTVVSSRAGSVTATAGGETVGLSFAKPGDTAAFATDARTVVLMRDGAEVCRLEARPASGEWTLSKECGQRESSVKEADLTCYTNFPHTACAPWGRPLPGRRLRVAVLTGRGNQIELGRLAERFDFDYRTVGVILAPGYGDKRKLGNPIFADGDHFSLINTADLERGIADVLKYDADVILVGGVPFEVFTADQRTLLLDKVKGGVGLVWIGQDRDVPELGFRLKGAKTSRQTPQASGSRFAPVPFALFGGEDAYAMEAPSNAVVHAVCDGSPYVMETAFGKGRVVNIAYRALSSRPWPSPGLTPANLRDFYADKAAPVEHYYSLVAKALLAAAGRTLPVTLGKAAVAMGDRNPGHEAKDAGTAAADAANSLAAAIEATAASAVATRWTWRVTDPFGRVVASGARDVELAAGTQTVALDGLAIPAVQGPLAFEAVVRDAAGLVLDWGAWVFSNEPKAAISSLSLDSAWHREGESASFAIAIGGDPAGMRLEISLVDSYGRTLETLSPPPAGEVSGTFVVSNALLSRCYTVDARLIDGAGLAVSRRRAELRVRPDAAKYAWDDFEIGTWASAENREYLWPDLAAIYHGIGISTLIANPERMQTDFPMRHNFHPTFLADAGLHRTPEPHEYTKTGDKMKLARPTCLSSPAFFEKRQKALDSLVERLPRYGLRFIWFGDEQSITGYGGNPVDFCFSEHCLREMRAFLKVKYATLERLNEEWETDFADWDAVVPFTRQEVWAADGRHVAGWADHLEFMDSRLTNSIAFTTRAIEAVDPAVRFALSGTQAPSAYGGTDWWKSLHVLDAALSYGVGGQFDIHRSFRPDGGFMPWNWGYSNRGAAAVASVWRTVFFGLRGLIGFQSTSQINCDWTFSQGLRDTLPHVRRLATGTGMHFVQNLRTRHDIAILYSQPSLRAAFIENRRKEHDNLEEKVRQLLMNLGYAYDYVSYEELADGVASSRGYRALVLADALAMSDAEVAAVQAFAAGGGTVIAEGVPATRRANCRPRDASPLAPLFASSTRHALFPDLDVRYLEAVKFPAKPENAKIVDAERGRYISALERAGIVADRIGIVDEETGAEVVNARIHPKADAAGNRTWCILAPSDEKERNASFTFPETAWTYDLVSGRAYGRVDKLRLPLRQGSPFAFAQYKDEVKLIEPVVTGPRVTVAFSAPVDGAVRLEVERPDGSPADCYAKNILVKDGRATHEIPFAPSDPQGRWRVRLTSVFGNESHELTLER